MRLFLIWLAAYVGIITVWQVVALVVGMSKMECAVITGLFSLYLTYPFARHAMDVWEAYR